MSDVETTGVADRAALVVCSLLFALFAAFTVIAVREGDAGGAAFSAAIAALAAAFTTMGICAGDYNSPSRVEERRIFGAEQMRQDRL